MDAESFIEVNVMVLGQGLSAEETREARTMAATLSGQKCGGWRRIKLAP